MASSPYGVDHRRARARLLPKAYGKPCPLCGEVMLRGQDLQLDHSTALVENPSSRGDRIVHGRCNESAGGRLGNARRDLRPSRVW